ncbi:amidohydrolase [Nakamurella antarctica]|uniref:Amidohydrolase n=1 Tax=Nakamurella antarctica TaxID=1902245 RepID=A0A3G8ZRX9_9ACTN|nr:amidohydrolase [Nakamurella antarctica]
MQHDDDDCIDFLAGHAIVIKGGVITAVLPVAEAASIRATTRIDGCGQVAMPGLINCHTHSPMTMFRGVAEDVPAEDWFNKYIWPMEVNLTDSDVRLGANLAMAEMIASGTTTFADHYFAMDAVADAVTESGLRANLGWTYFSSDGKAGLEKSLEFALRRRGTADGRIQTSLAPHGTYTVNDADLETTAALALEHDLLVHIHAAESRAESRRSVAVTGFSPIQVLENTGVLHARTLIAHGTGIVADDIPILARHAHNVGVASAPKGYLKMAWDTTPVRLLRSGGIAVGLATDGAASNNTLDVWESMMFTALIQKSVETDPTYMPAQMALWHATTGSARALGMQDHIGKLATGFKADIILIDLSGPHTQPIHNVASTLVYSARSADITTTIVDGNILMADRILRTVDIAPTMAALVPRLSALTDLSHGKTLQTYGDQA